MSRLLPLLAFFALVGLLGFGIWWNKHHEMNEVPSPLIGKPAPEFTLPLLYDSAQSLSKRDLLGKPYLINVFGSWCVTCHEEHPVLMAEAKKLGVPLIGMAWKDPPADSRRWLEKFGNPYDQVVSDADGRMGIEFGVYGAPETFLVDAQGVIRYKRIGMLTPELIASELKPQLAKVRQATP
ncbi:MAG: DsbE family thiol:disulfide interchange protein [Proteobacteria bacterium]|uniref:DsbE family thiol:disulfide interchange protein n=1 Tax=Rudaea sp. TaxID=2136325 RepID=UPI001DB683FD|nr:DsbE family thiol:disulfide interchange protein [Pseudomonadota bacterium]MBS0566495.1 DsbE family thiol:disulfide interchange protein [Pseudomonadota bacterium]